MSASVVTLKVSPRELQVIVASLKVAAKTANYHVDGMVHVGPTGGGRVNLLKLVRGNVPSFRTIALALVDEIGME